MLCFYAYGSCNTAIDRAVFGSSRNSGLSSEGFYTWNQARAYLNAHAPQHAVINVGDELNTIWDHGNFFREDLTLTTSNVCPFYRITQKAEAGEQVLYQTTDAPVTMVTSASCMSQ